MTIEETVKVLSHEMACVKRQTGLGCDRNCAACDLVLPDELVISAYRTALSILRAQQEVEKNEPLTLDELHQMDGLPVFVENRGRFKKRFPDEWAIVDYADKKVSSARVNYHLCDYGKTWVAYSHQPKEVQT